MSSNAMDPQTVLLVEDNQDDRLLAIRSLEKCSVPVNLEMATDGAEALTALFGKPGGPEPALPRLVILDLKLPKRSGIEVLRAIRENERTALLPVIVLTSSDDPTDLLDCYRLHCNGYVNKAIDFERYTENMRLLVGFWLEVNRLPVLSPKETATVP